MQPMIRTVTKTSAEADLLTVPGARRAAMLAANVAGIARQRALRTSLGLGAAGEAVAAAELALRMADEAATTDDRPTMRARAAEAWAAAQRAIAAERRVTLVEVAVGR